MKIFQIVENRVHWQTPFTSLDEAYEVYLPETGLLFVEASDDVQEGWGYDDEQETFIPPFIPETPPDPLELIQILINGII